MHCGHQRPKDIHIWLKRAYGIWFCSWGQKNWQMLIVESLSNMSDVPNGLVAKKKRKALNLTEYIVCFLHLSSSSANLVCNKLFSAWSINLPLTILKLIIRWILIFSTSRLPPWWAICRWGILISRYINIAHLGYSTIFISCISSSCYVYILTSIQVHLLCKKCIIMQRELWTVCTGFLRASTIHLIPSSSSWPPRPLPLSLGTTHILPCWWIEDQNILSPFPQIFKSSMSKIVDQQVQNNDYPVR